MNKHRSNASTKTSSAKATTNDTSKSKNEKSIFYLLIHHRILK